MTTLLIDADDTLWENITVFNAVNRAYVDWLLPGRSIHDMQAELDAWQIDFIATHGYGRNTFELSLIGGVEQFAGRVPSDADRAKVKEIVQPLRWDQLDLCDGVVDTLSQLSYSCELLLVTKGDRAEQQQKIDRSELAVHFDHIEILDDKTPEQYRRIIEQHSLDPLTTSMVGNSPRSDIAPALEVGLGAVFLPHAETWSHESSTVVPDHPRLLTINTFRDLLDHFS